MTRGGPVGTTLVYTIRVVEAANHFRFGVGVAMGMTLFPLLGLFILLLSRYMLAGQAQAEPGPSQPGQATATIAYYLAWPWLRLLKLWQHLFWTLNDSLERLGEKAGAGLGWSHRLAKPVARSGAAIALSLLLLFELLPFYWVIVTSFKTTLQLTTWSSILWPRPWTLEQYYLLFGPERNFVLWYGKTLLVSLISPLIATFVGAFGAYGLARLRWRGRSTFSSFVLVTYLTPGVLLVIPLLLIFQGLGLRNSLWSLILSYPSFTLPFALWLMMGYYAAIPEELEAAGLIDGCTRFQLFYRIVLPLTKPALVATFLFGMIHAWGEFLFASLFLHGQMNITLPVGLAFMVLTEVAPWGEVTAASLLMSLPVLIFYLMAQNFMVEGLAAGAIRGRG
jgi:multiple sugar transport system permease protein